MRNVHGIYLLLTLAFLLNGIRVHAADRPPMNVVPQVDLNKYVGKWYEVGRMPNSFQGKCTGNVTATYELRTDGKITVLNQCKEASGKIKSAKGKAKVADKETNAKLRVTFFWPFYGDYWIIELGPDYEYAVVGEPKRKYCWILSRTPEISEELYTDLLKRIKDHGYDTSRWIRTRNI